MSVSFRKTHLIAIGCILLLGLSCKRKITPVQTQANLKQAMQHYLQTQPNYDSTRVRFDVQDVAFFEDSTWYICQFKVRMKIPSRGLDTVGIMMGNVSKDFSIVHRKY